MPKLTMTTAQALSLDKADFLSMSDAQQRQVARQLIDIANKRFQRGVKTWGEFGALRVYADKTQMRADKTGKTIMPMQRGKQSIVGKTGTELYQEFALAKEFLNLPTSTAKGRTEAKKKFEQTIGSKLTIPEFKHVFDIYNKTKELHEAGVLSLENIYGSDDILRDMADFVKDGGTVDEWLEDADERIDDMYESAIEEQNAFDEYIRLKTKKGRKSNADKQRLQELQRRFGFGSDEIV